MAYLYRHIRLDNNVPFYIGIGKSDSDYNRAYSTKSRNFSWNNIVKSTNYRVDIMIENLTWEDACKKEIEFICLYKKNKENGFLCNVLDGGEKSLSEEINLKRKNTLKGHFVSEKTKDKIRQKAIGRKAKEITKIKMSAIHKQIKTGHWLEYNGHKNGRAFPIYQYDKNGVFIKEWECAKYAIDYYKLNKTAISDCIMGRQRTAGGFIWTKNKIKKNETTNKF